MHLCILKSYKMIRCHLWAQMITFLQILQFLFVQGVFVFTAVFTKLVCFVFSKYALTSQIGFSVSFVRFHCSALPSCVCQASLMKTSYEECFYYPILLYQMPVLILRYLPVRVVNVNMSYTLFKKKIHFFPTSHSGRFCPMKYNTRHTKRRPCFMEYWRF